MTLALVVLAAGSGSRFGGNKHLADVGPSGQSLLEYSVHDALLAGFDHIVMVISHDADQIALTEKLRLQSSRIRKDFVFQSLTDGHEQPAEINHQLQSLGGRTKPWGTAHAVLSCCDVIDSPFVVINADDFYGASNFHKLAEFLRLSTDPTMSVMPGYQLGKTLSHHGGVNRGICTVDDDGLLVDVAEALDIVIDSDNPQQCLVRSDATRLPIHCLVSMNMWGFQPTVFPLLQRAFQNFLIAEDSTTLPDLTKRELYIPNVICAAIQNGEIGVKLLPSQEIWQGLTYRDDIAVTRQFLAKLTHQGRYPDSFH